MEEEEKELRQKFATKSLEELEWTLKIMTTAAELNEEARDVAYQAFKESTITWTKSMRMRELVFTELENRKKS